MKKANTKFKFNIITYGCSNNIAESQIMENTLSKNGFQAADFADSDIVIVNSCSVKSVTENKIIHRIRQIQQNYPRKKIIIAGCMPESEYEILREIAPKASLLSTHHIDEVSKAVKETLDGNCVEVLGKARLNKSAMNKQRANGAIDILPISQGCLSACAFCSTKIAKGALFSYPEQDIINSIKSSVKEGVKEFWITSQDCGCYGFDKKTNLAELINKITAIDGNFRIRIGMMNPEHVKKILPDLIEAYKSEKVFKFLHLPIQSGSDEILLKMRRKYSADDVLKITSEFRAAITNITIWTDIIEGFPGETDLDFKKTVDMVKKISPDNINVSAYGNRPKTAASKMLQVKSETKKARTQLLAALARKMSLEKNRNWAGWVGPVLIDEYNEKKKTWIGRNYAYKPVILKGAHNFGDSIDVIIKTATRNSLFAN